MKSDEISSMSEADIKRALDESRQELFNLRFQISTRKIKNHQRIPAVKKDIARLMTALREREFMRMYGGAELEPQEAAPVALQEAPRRRALFGRNK